MQQAMMSMWAMEYGLLVAERIPKGSDTLRRLGRQFKAYSLDNE
jgi:hypothetical protein